MWKDRSSVQLEIFCPALALRLIDQQINSQVYISLSQEHRNVEAPRILYSTPAGLPLLQRKVLRKDDRGPPPSIEFLIIVFNGSSMYH